jgi:hypothetical protein
MRPDWNLVSEARWIREVVNQLHELRQMRERADTTASERDIIAQEMALLERELDILKGRDARPGVGIVEDH